jgi:hypothetical protein
MGLSRLLFGLSTAAAAMGAALLLRDRTTDSDATGETVARASVPQGSGALGPRAVEVLSRHVGAHGQGEKGTAGYHRSPFIDEVCRGLYQDAPGLIGKPWCARAVRWAYETAAKELGLPPPFSQIRGALSFASDWRAAPFGKFQLAAPKVGAALILGHQHATLIAQVLDQDTVVTVEGNHGDSVAHVRRTLRPKDAIVDIEAYAASVRGAAPPAPAVVGWFADLDLLDAELVVA